MKPEQFQDPELDIHQCHRPRLRQLRRYVAAIIQIFSSRIPETFDVSSSPEVSYVPVANHDVICSVILYTEQWRNMDAASSEETN